MVIKADKSMKGQNGLDSYSTSEKKPKQCQGNQGQSLDLDL